MDTWLEWARGPAFRACLAFMILGLIRHMAIILYETFRNVWRAGDKTLPYRAVTQTTLSWLVPVGRLRDRFVYSATTLLFHVSIIVVPLLLGGHILLWERGIGVSWPAIPNGLADALTILALSCAALLIVQRATARDTRSLSRASDYVLPAIVALPFASGFLVMHQSVNPFSFPAMMLLHVASADLLLLLIPITKLSHCALLPWTQLVSEVAWHFPSKSGSEVALLLGKEDEPV